MKTRYLFLAVLIFISAGNNFGSCGSSSCPLYINNPLSRGAFNLGLSYEYIYQNQIYVGSNKSFVGAIPEHHDEVSTLNQVTAFSMQYSAFDFLRLDLSVPFIHREHAHIHHHQGEEVWESWNYSGVGDAILSGTFSLINNEEHSSGLYLNAGIKLRTGVTDVKNNKGEEAEVTIQPGTGSTDFIIGASYFKSLVSLSTLEGSQYSSFPVALSVNYKMNGKGTEGYQFGNELLLHVSTAYRFVEKISLLLQVNARFQAHANVGDTDEPEENTGGKWVFVSPGLKFYLSDDISLYSYLQLPIYQNVNGIQQAAPYNIRIGINKELDLLN